MNQRAKESKPWKHQHRSEGTEGRDHSAIPGSTGTEGRSTASDRKGKKRETVPKESPVPEKTKGGKAEETANVRQGKSGSKSRSENGARTLHSLEELNTIRDKLSEAPAPVPPKQESSKKEPPKPEDKKRVKTAVIRERYEESEAMTLADVYRYDAPPKEDVPVRKKKKEGCSRVNLEDGMPTVEQALTSLRLEIQTARHTGTHLLKLIHGYGSSGVGGKINAAVRKELSAMKQRGYILDFITGEEFGPFAFREQGLQQYRERLSADPDFARYNHGITIVLL